MKKFISFITVFAIFSMVLAAPFKTNAATADSVAGKVITTSGRLNVRSSASTNGNIVTSLTNNKTITLISKSGDWWQVEYDKGKYGYCHADYIKTIGGKAKTVTLSSGSLNVRSGAGTNYSKVSALNNGEIVIELSANDGWSEILYHGTKTGYVSSKYLSEGYKAIRLSVPSYKQTDKRWADVKIGSSGKTIAQIGCATTGIAMMESYRTGKTLTPDVMAKQLKYTASGSVYWPSNFAAITNQNGLLRNIHTNLTKIRPILFGAKTASGKQHWVVVTGFLGGALTADRFTILDPGSNTRTTLQQFLNAYPNFYKYFYYF